MWCFSRAGRTGRTDPEGGRGGGGWWQREGEGGEWRVFTHAKVIPALAVGSDKRRQEATRGSGDDGGGRKSKSSDCTWA